MLRETDVEPVSPFPLAASLYEIYARHCAALAQGLEAASIRPAKKHFPP
jgi:hypothetical protein